MDITSIALGGLNQAQAKLESTAKRLAAAGATTPEGLPVDTVDLSTDVISLLSARHEFAANIKTLKVADDMQRYTLNMLG